MERFREILKELGEMHERDRNHSGGDLSSFRVCERMGVPAWKGVLVMMGEKMGRLMNVARSENPEVQSGSLAEIFTELAAHSIVARILLEDPQAASREQDSGPRRGRRQGQREKKDSIPENADFLPGDNPDQTNQL